VITFLKLHFQLTTEELAVNLLVFCIKCTQQQWRRQNTEIGGANPASAERELTRVWRFYPQWGSGKARDQGFGEPPKMKALVCF
jgi:hypothetical protein